MYFGDNSTNYFGCIITDEVREIGVNNAKQGYCNLGFGILTSFYMLYFIYIMIRLLKIKASARTSFIYTMITLTLLILVTLALLIFVFFDYVLYCISGSIFEITAGLPILLSTVSIFLFDYMICAGLLQNSPDNDEIRETLFKKIRFIFKFKLPLLVIYILLNIFSDIYYDLQTKSGKILAQAYSIYSILYLFTYFILLIINMNYFGFVIKSKAVSAYQQVHCQLVMTKAALLIHFLSRILWIVTINFYIIFFSQKNNWFNKLTSYCFDKGCVWPMLIYFVARLLMIFIIYFAFGVFIFQFSSMDDSKISNNSRSSNTYSDSPSNTNTNQIIKDGSPIFINENYYS